MTPVRKTVIGSLNLDIKVSPLVKRTNYFGKYNYRIKCWQIEIKYSIGEKGNKKTSAFGGIILFHCICNYNTNNYGMSKFHIYRIIYPHFCGI
jgi:hypothetical protein